MRKLTYWHSDCIDDSKAYSIRTKTKREAVAIRAENCANDLPDCPSYGPVTKVTFEYHDAFDLLKQATQEVGCYWEPSALNGETNFGEDTPSQPVSRPEE